MAAKKTSNRNDPKTNKSLAIRTVLDAMPEASAAEVVDAVKKQFGHTIKPNMVYMVKTKNNMAANSRRTKTPASQGKPVGAAQWVEAIRIGRQLLKVTGSVDNATALLKAING